MSVALDNRLSGVSPVSGHSRAYDSGSWAGARRAESSCRAKAVGRTPERGLTMGERIASQVGAGAEIESGSSG